MSNTVKCVSCNIVIDELLAYIQNKVSIADEVTLAKICTSAFSSDQIHNSKTLLLESLSSEVRSKVRKGKGKDNRVLNDIIAIFKSEPDHLPIFVARDLEKLPPITFDHLDVSKLLKDMVLVQADIKNIKSSYVTQDELHTMKKECEMRVLASLPDRNVNANQNDYNKNNVTRVSSENEPGCSGISSVAINNNCSNININQIGGSGEKLPQMANCINSDSEAVTNRAASDVARVDVTRLPLLSSSSGPGEQLIESVTNQTAQYQSYATVAMREMNGDFTLIQSKKQKYKDRRKGNIGSVVVASEEKFRSADRNIPMFLSNVHRDTVESDIINYIQNKTGEKVSLEKIKINRPCEHNAYKFFVSQSKLQMYLDDKLWPQGVVFRRFINYRPKHIKHMNEHSTITSVGT